MRYTDLPVAVPGMANKVSVLGFGGSPLLGRAGRKASLQALHEAHEAGINFFDTARSYGYGESEGLLGEFLSGRRDSVVICTKFGILPSPRGSWKRRLKPIAQAAVGVFPRLRGIARRQAAGQFLHGQFTAEVLRFSLEASLRELRTEYVDMLLLHDADAGALENAELRDELERLVSSGIVRMAGLSGPHNTIKALAEQPPRFITTAQFAADPPALGFLDFLAGMGTQRFFMVGNHPFGGEAGVKALTQCLVSLRTDARLAQNIREKLCGDLAEILPEVVFGCILDGTGVSAVVAAMVNPRNLRNNVRAITQCRFSPEELKTLRRVIPLWLKDESRADVRPIEGSAP